MPKKKAAAKKKSAPKKRPGTQARAAALTSILLNVEGKMKSKQAKATMTDYIRLTQLAKEMVEEEPKTEIRVGWVDSTDL